MLSQANDLQSNRRLYNNQDDVPDDVQEMRLAERAGQLDIVQSLGDALVEKRKKAQEYRTNCGIEQDWREDEEFYQGIDAANPEGETNVNKPVSADGGPIGIQGRAAPQRSTVFINITRSYVDAASARVSDMLLPTDDAPWSIKATPMMSEMEVGGSMTQVAQATGAMAGGPMPEGAIYAPGKEVPPMDPAAAQAMGMSPDMAAGAAPFSMPLNNQPVVVSETDKSPEDKKAEQATKVITDWLIECQWHAEVRKVIEDASLLGTGVLKGPIPMVKIAQKYSIDPATGQGRLVRIEEIKPVSVRVNPRNFWCDPAAGEDVQKGSYTWEFDQIGARMLRRFKEDPTYIKEMIDQVLKEGPSKSYLDNPDASESRVEVGATYPIWYFYGDIDRETLIAAGIPEDDFPDEGDVAIPAMITMVNDTVIKASLNPLENGGFPYDVMPWQRRSGMIWGKGIARQIRTPQRQLNAAERSDMDNGGLTSGPMWAIRQKWIVPIDGQNVLSPRKGFYMTEDAPPQAKIQDAISFTNIQSNAAEQQGRIARAKQNAEDATGLPMLMQGQQGDATDTAAGMTILNNNGSTVLRRIARTFDDYITERHIRRYYYWLLENPGNEDAKGDFQIDARGSTALVERDLQNQALNNLAGLFLQHPDVHKGRFAEELAKANRLDPKRFMLTEAEKKQRDSQPPPVPEAIQVQQLRNEGAMQVAGAKEQGRDKDRDLAMGQLQADYETNLAELEQARTDSSEDNAVKEQALKVKLAETVMKIEAQRNLEAQNKRHEALMTPPTEPNGRAEPGKAIYQ